MQLDRLLESVLDDIGAGDRVVIQPVGIDDSYRWLQVVCYADTGDVDVLDCFGYPVMRDGWVQEHGYWEVVEGLELPPVSWED